MIDRVVNDLGRKLVEVPVGLNGLLMVCLTAVSALAGKKCGRFFPAFRRYTVVHPKDGIIMRLLAAEITAVTGKNPQEHYNELANRFGAPSYNRLQAARLPHKKRRCLSCLRKW